MGAGEGSEAPGGGCPSSTSERRHDALTLCVVTSFVKPLPIEEKKEHLRIGERCGLRIEHVVGA